MENALPCPAWHNSKSQFVSAKSLLTFSNKADSCIGTCCGKHNEFDDVGKDNIVRQKYLIS